MQPNLFHMLLNKHKIVSGLLLISLAASIFSCNGINEDLIAPEDIISLKILDSSGSEITEKIGNGSDLIILQAQVWSDLDDEFRTVTFKSSEGDFEGISTNAAAVMADNLGIAQTMLRLPLKSGELFLSAEIKGKEEVIYSSEKTINLSSVDNVISLNFKTLDGQMLSDIPRADGTTIFQVEGQVLVNTDDLNSITFNASNGEFQQTGTTEIQKNKSEDSFALVSYKVPQGVGPVFFSAKTGSSLQYVSEDNLVFERAHAEEIFIEPATLNMNSSSGNIISAFLTRISGKVSLETRVEYEAFQLINDEEVPVGRFTGASSAVSDSNGEVTATFFADTGDVDFLLPVTIRVSTSTDSNGTISTVLDINVSE